MSNWKEESGGRLEGGGVYQDVPSTVEGYFVQPGGAHLRIRTPGARRKN